MQKIITHYALQKYLSELFVQARLNGEEAELVSRHLVRNSLMGIDTHGLNQVPRYLREIEQNVIRIPTKYDICVDTNGLLIVDCAFSFGLVTAEKLAGLVKERIKNSNIVLALTKRSNHVGRLGHYAELLAESGCICLAFVAQSNKYPMGHSVAPWGGKLGKLGTNPIAYGVPTDGDPIVFDAATSMITDGAVQVKYQNKEKLPLGFIQDTDGKLVDDPAVMFSEKPGSILPFGYPYGTHKGFALSLFNEMLTCVTTGDVPTEEDHARRYSNDLCLIAIQVGSIDRYDNYLRNIAQYADYIRQTPVAPGFDKVNLPGDIEQRKMKTRLKNGIPLDDHIVSSLESWEKKLQTDISVRNMIKEF